MKDKGEFSTLFADAPVPTPGVGGDWGGTVNGDQTFGQGAAPKGVAGIMPEVTYVDINGAPGPNEKAPIADIAGGIPRDMKGGK